MSLFIGIDPDLHSTAIAWLDGKGKLVEVYTTSVHKNFKGREAAINTTEQLRDFAPLLTVLGTQAIAVEGQEIYQGGNSRPKDILMLATVAGACLQWAAAREPAATYLPLPKEWKGSVPKHIHQARILKKLGVESKKMSGYCVPVYPPGHKFAKIKAGQWKHIVDAIGLAQFALRSYQLLHPSH